MEKERGGRKIRGVEVCVGRVVGIVDSGEGRIGGLWKGRRKEERKTEIE